jgi:hypothetical protein
VDYSYGMPISVSPSGIGIDVDRNIHLPIPVNGDTTKMKEFTILTGMTSSFYEHKILEDIYSAESVSAIKIIQTANERGIPIFTINNTNSATYLNSLQVSNEVKSNVINAVNAGKEVIIPSQDIQVNDWIGTGYIVSNLQTGAAAYMISGGLAGGVFAVWSLNLPYSYDVPAVEISGNVNRTLSCEKTTFSGADGTAFSSDDVTYCLIDLMRLPESERDNYYDPHPDRGDRGIIKIDDSNSNDYLTVGIKLKDFQSNDGAPYLRVHQSIIWAIQLMSGYAGADDVEITSGYRTKSHNQTVGGKSKSWHMDGLAADVRITINGKSTLQDIGYYKKLKEAAILVIGKYGGIGCYPGEGKRFIHMDTRGTPAKWPRGCK